MKHTLSEKIEVGSSISGSWSLLGMDELFLRFRFPKRAQRVNWTNSSIILCPKSGHEPGNSKIYTIWATLLRLSLADDFNPKTLIRDFTT